MTNKKVDVRTPDGKKDGTVELPAALFDVEPNIALMHQVVVAQLAAKRQGTHSTKTRGEVSGGGKKPYRQKGTGRARQGSTRAPQFNAAAWSTGRQVNCRANCTNVTTHPTSIPTRKTRLQSRSSG